MLCAPRVSAPILLITLFASACVLAAGRAADAGDSTAPTTYTLPYKTSSAQPRPDLELTALQLLNQQRVARGLRPLALHTGLQAVARAHGAEMFTYGFLSHRSRDGRDVDARVRDHRLRVHLLAENLAYAPSVSRAHEALMASDGHRRNMLLPDFRLVGLAVMDGGAYGVIVVQVFADVAGAEPLRARHHAPQYRPVTPQRRV